MVFIRDMIRSPRALLPGTDFDVLNGPLNAHGSL
jgi:hypothetical protein